MAYGLVAVGQIQSINYAMVIVVMEKTRAEKGIVGVGAGRVVLRMR